MDTGTSLVFFTCLLKHISNIVIEVYIVIRMNIVFSVI